MTSANVQINKSGSTVSQRCHPDKEQQCALNALYGATEIIWDGFKLYDLAAKRIGNADLEKFFESVRARRGTVRAK